MKFQPRASSTHEYVDAFIFAMMGGGKTGFIIDTYWENDGSANSIGDKWNMSKGRKGRGGPVVFDADKGGVDATAADMGFAGKIPIFPLTNFDEIIYSCTYHEEVINAVHEMPGFEDYEVDIFAWDTLSSMEDEIMGEPKRASSDLLPADPGYGVMAKTRGRDDPFAPALQDYKGQIQRTKAFIRHVRSIPMHTIVTCHAVRELEEDSAKGLSVREEDKRYGIFPDLVGKNRYTAAKLHDIYMFMEARGNDFYGYTTKRGGAPSRTRFKAHLKPELKSPQFRDFIALNNKLRLTTP